MRRTILVTGINGDVGFTVVRLLQAVGGYNCIGTDITQPDVHAQFVKKYCTLPKADTPNYISAIKKMCRDNNVQIIIPTSDAEIIRLGKYVGDSLVMPEGQLVLCQPHRFYKTFGDKLTCMETLSENPGITLAKFCDGKSKRDINHLIDTVGFPLVVKERIGQGSKKVYVVTNETELFNGIEQCSFPLVQEFIDDKFGEYSVGILSQKGVTNTIAFKRELSEGMGTVQGSSTWYAELDNDKEVIQYANEIARYIHGEGSYNIQVRKSSQGVRLLEINPRFSGLVGFRHFCGFTDLVWSLQSRLVPDWKLPPYHPPSSEARFWRYVSETMTFGNIRKEGIW